MSADLGLGRALTNLGGHLDYPPTPPLAEVVLARISEAERAPRSAAVIRPLRPPRPSRLRLRLRRWTGPGSGSGGSRWPRVAVAVALLLVLAALLATPAVARRMGLRGITIHLGGPAPTLTTAPAPGSSTAGGSASSSSVTTLPAGGGPLGLGQRATVAQARGEARFAIRVPTDPALGPPDAVYVAQDIPGGRVSMVWRSRPGLPASRFTGVGLLLTEFGGQGYGGKFAGPGVQVETVTVAGAAGDAFWVSGAPHIFGFQDTQGQFREDTLRLAGPTLIWQSGDVTLRLEGKVSKEAAVRIANSMR